MIELVFVILRPSIHGMITVCGRCRTEEVHPDVDEVCQHCNVQLLWTLQTIFRAIEYTTIDIRDMPDNGPWMSQEVRVAIGKIITPESCIS